MKTIVLTGGIASGKTSAGKIFESLGAIFINADDLVTKLYKKKEIKKILVKNFGKTVASDKVNKKELAKIVFSDKKKLKKLNSLIHPLVFNEIQKKLLQHKKTSKLIVIEIPLFFEAKSKTKPDYVITVSCEKNLQLNRLEKKGLSKEQAIARMNSQLSVKEKEKKADFVVKNNGHLSALKAQVKKIFETINSLT